MGQHAVEQGADTRTVHFHADEVLLRCRSGHLQQRVTHAETDFEGTRGRTAKDLIEINRGVGQRQHEQLFALIQAALLAFGHSTGAHHEALDAPVMAVIVWRFGIFVIHHFIVRKRVGRLRINHQQALT